MAEMELNGGHWSCGSKHDLSFYDVGFAARSACVQNSKDELPLIRILLLADQFDFTCEGVAGTNRKLAIFLTKYSGVKISSTVFQPSDQISAETKYLSELYGVQLISLTENVCSIAPNRDPSRLYTELSTSPQKFVHRFVPDGVQSGFQAYTHIIGHSPITCKLALYLHEHMFRDAKLILFFHTIPSELEWLSGEVDGYDARQTDEEHIEMAQKADVVYSVTPKIHEPFRLSVSNTVQRSNWPSPLHPSRRKMGSLPQPFFGLNNEYFNSGADNDEISK